MNCLNGLKYSLGLSVSNLCSTPKAMYEVGLEKGLENLQKFSGADKTVKLVKALLMTFAPKDSFPEFETFAENFKNMFYVFTGFTQIRSGTLDALDLCKNIKSSFARRSLSTFETGKSKFDLAESMLKTCFSLSHMLECTKKYSSLEFSSATKLSNHLGNYRIFGNRFTGLLLRKPTVFFTVCTGFFGLGSSLIKVGRSIYQLRNIQDLNEIKTNTDSRNRQYYYLLTKKREEETGEVTETRQRLTEEETKALDTLRTQFELTNLWTQIANFGRNALILCGDCQWKPNTYHAIGDTVAWSGIVTTVLTDPSKK